MNLTLNISFGSLLMLFNLIEKFIVKSNSEKLRREYFKNTDNLPIRRGEKIVVATSPGHDVGEVTLTGYMAEKQFGLKPEYLANPV